MYVNYCLLKFNHLIRFSIENVYFKTYFIADVPHLSVIVNNFYEIFEGKILISVQKKSFFISVCVEFSIGVVLLPNINSGRKSLLSYL